MFPFPRIKTLVSRRDRPGRKTQNRIERGHRVEAAVEAEDKLVEVGLQVVRGYRAVMGAEQPCFQVGENQMDHGKMRFRFVRIAVQFQGVVTVSERCEAIVAVPAIGAHRGAKGDVVGDEGYQVFGGAVRNHAEPQAPGID